MDYETLSSFLLSNFFLTDWERTWLESRFDLIKEDLPIWENLTNKYRLFCRVELLESK